MQVNDEVDNKDEEKKSLSNLLWGIQKEFRLKVFFQAATFLLMSSCLAIWRPLKISVFSKIVGSSYIPEAKLYSLFFLIPLIIFYSKLVDILRRHQLLYCFNLFHGAGGIILYYFLSHPVYGIANTDTSPYRLTGWFFYFFMESFNAFLSTVFWSFADSINKPKDAQNYYGLIVSGSKIGGILSAGSLYVAISFFTSTSNSVLLSNSLLIGSLMLFAAAGSIYFLIKMVPGYYMHGYEKVYQLEKQREPEKSVLQKTSGNWITGFIQSIKKAFEGLIIILKNPYVLGIFSIIIIYEIMIVIIDYRVAITADIAFPSVGKMTQYYALYYLLMNSVGLVISFFGTTAILKLLGIRISLFIFPLASAAIILITFFYPTATIFFIALVTLRALNYALNHPIREILYIPTIKDIKFKAKAWTDAFGSRIAKGGGSFFNIGMKKATPAFALFFSTALTMGLISIWFVIVYFLGKTLKDALDNQKIIGNKTD
ncbi:MAG: Npt1/Npt2 family nucleotide transporter [bacterium]